MKNNEKGEPIGEGVAVLNDGGGGEAGAGARGGTSSGTTISNAVTTQETRKANGIRKDEEQRTGGKREETGDLAAKDGGQGGSTSNAGSKMSKSEGGESGFVEIEGGLRSKNPTDAVSENPRPSSLLNPLYGIPLHCETAGNFPAVGSQLGDYFCLGQLGKGTFSSIHKCANLSYFHRSNSDRKKPRLAAAKVELSNFSQSGVLESEAMIMDYLDKSLPSGTAPVYMGHYKSGDYAAILMEYLPGEDMHYLREQVITGSTSRRISVEDAVYLTADVMLPLLERMHDVGIVHRDVKPSNCVRSTADDKRDFCIVDFGLSKSIVVAQDSPFADKDHPWKGKDWLKPLSNSGQACYRLQRPKAEFRGTSMYASLRVHQQKDYAPRDDVWSLLYVFCDLVSGGLPWMSYAATRDRDMCGKIKEKVHGEEGEDHTDKMLMGDEYHVAMYKRQQKQEAGETSRLGPDPAPLPMSQDKKKVDLLRKAFQHVAGLEFWDRPDYGLVQECIRGFLTAPSLDPPVRPIVWLKEELSPSRKRRRSLTTALGRVGHDWDLPDQPDPLEQSIFEAAEDEMDAESEVDDDDFRNRLPVELRFRLAQMEFNANRSAGIPQHLALRDWMKVTLVLLYEDWDVRTYEEAHRTSTDGFRRDNYLALLLECWKWAETFNFFRSRGTFFCVDDNGDGDIDGDAKVDNKNRIDGEALTKNDDKSQPTNRAKRRKVISSSTSSSKSDFVNLSRALFGLKAAIEAEETKKPPPPGRILFGGHS